MAEDISDLINNVKKMVDSNAIPDNVKDVLNTISSSKNSSEKQINSNNLNIDIDTIIKMKTIIESINSSNDPRSNLLNSLKPYLRESRKSKLDQYINLLNMSKIAEIMNYNKKENSSNDKWFIYR